MLTVAHPTLTPSLAFARRDTLIASADRSRLGRHTWVDGVPTVATPTFAAVARRWWTSLVAVTVPSLANG